MKKKEKQVLLLAILVIAAVIVAGNFQGYSLGVSEGDSMMPTFTGCTLLVINEKIPAEEAIFGEIVVVDISSLNGDFNKISHRLVDNDEENEKFSTRGENSSYYDFPSSIDGYFPYADFKGVVKNYFNLPKEFCNFYGGE